MLGQPLEDLAERGLRLGGARALGTGRQMLADLGSERRRQAFSLQREQMRPAGRAVQAHRA